MKNILNLIRYKNILFVIIIQILMYWCVAVPTLRMFGLQSQTSGVIVALYIFATALIAAGGYVINDYFDIKIDRINKPDKVIITTGLSKRSAMRLYQALTITGVLCGITTAIIQKNITLGLIFIIVPGMLWFYSASYKRQLIVGNIIVASMAALVPLVPLIAENATLSNCYGELLKQTPVASTLYTAICLFALFSFLFTLAREIVKDMQDSAGDREFECHTIPIVWGETAAKLIVSVIIILTCMATAWVAYRLITFEGTLTARYFIFGIAIPSLCAITIMWSKSCTAYKDTSMMIKFIMAVGVAYAVVYNYLLAKNFDIPFLEIFKIM